jgi:hypothetical protein
MGGGRDEPLAETARLLTSSPGAPNNETCLCIVNATLDVKFLCLMNLLLESDSDERRGLESGQPLGCGLEPL